LETRPAIGNDSDSGLIKRGFVLLILMALLVIVVLFILFQGRRSPVAKTTTHAEDYAWSVAVPSAIFPANVSWGALHEVATFMPSPVGWEIRQNAAATLARRGSDQVPWQLFREMLDVQRATVNLREQLKREELKDGQEESPEASARDLVAIALKALAEWHAERRKANKTEIPPGLPAVCAMVDRLAEGPASELQELAKKTQTTFFAR
jgi:hypothetical protein